MLSWTRATRARTVLPLRPSHGRFALLRKKLALGLVVAVSAGLGGGAQAAVAGPQKDTAPAVTVTSGNTAPAQARLSLGWDHGL